MTYTRRQEYTGQQKAALVAILLKEGSKLTTAGVARLTKMTWEGAEKMCQMLSGVLPIVKQDGYWRWLDE